MFVVIDHVGVEHLLGHLGFISQERLHFVVDHYNYNKRMSDKNEEIKTITFDNKIPVICMLSAQESQNDEEVFPLLLMIPRVHYISLYHSRIHNHFKKYLNNMVQLNDLYLSYNNTRIDWALFFGVFFDTHFYEYSNNLPLRIQVNYR